MATRIPLAIPTREKPRQAIHNPAARPASRIGKRGVQAWMEPEVVKQLNQIALDDDTTVQLLIEDAISLLFVQRSRPSLRRASPPAR